MIKRILLLALIIPWLSSCASSDEDTNYKQACRKGNFEKAHEIINKQYDKYEQVWKANFVDIITYDRHTENTERRIAEVKAVAAEYCTIVRYVYSVEIRKLILEKSENYENTIANFFYEIQKVGEKVDSGEKYSIYNRENKLSYDCYQEYVKTINAIADVIMELAILNHNKQLAKIAYSNYLEKPVLEEYSYEKFIEYSNKPKEDAETRLVVEGLLDETTITGLDNDESIED
jgi:hypothetical protein